MTVLTMMEIKGSYPENILITSAGPVDGKYSCWMYMLRGGTIHKAMVNSEPVFDTAEEAETYLHDLCKIAVEYDLSNANTPTP